jgi:Uma2 family endonuclease
MKECRMAGEKTTLTAEDLLRLPDNGMRHELVRGELRSMPFRSAEDGLIAGQALFLIRDYVRPRGLGFSFAAGTGFLVEHDPDLVRAPALAFIAADGLQGWSPSPEYSELVPDLVVEIISTDDSPGEIEEKVHDWLNVGVRLAWVVHPSTRSVTVYRSRSDIRIVGEDESLDGGDVLPGFTCRVGDLLSC